MAALQPTHFVYLRQSIEEPCLSFLLSHCFKSQAKTESAKGDVFLQCTKVDDGHMYYLNVTAIYGDNKTINLRIPHNLILMIREISTGQEASRLAFGFVPPSQE